VLQLVKNPKIHGIQVHVLEYVCISNDYAASATFYGELWQHMRRRNGYSFVP
jgi:hypothetical protein